MKTATTTTILETAVTTATTAVEGSGIPEPSGVSSANNDIIMFGEKDEETVLVGFGSALAQSGSGSVMADVVADLDMGDEEEDEVSRSLLLRRKLLTAEEVAFEMQQVADGGGNGSGPPPPQQQQ